MSNDYQEFKFKLYRKSDRRLLARILEQADGTSENGALRFLCRHWFEVERQGNRPQLGSPCRPQLEPNQPGPDISDEAALDQLEDLW